MSSPSLTRRTLWSLTAALLVAVSAQAQTSDPGLARLESELKRLSAIAQGTVGIGIIHLESGRELFVNGSEPFPMASTYKVPIAVQMLTKVDRGTARLDSMITVAPSDLHPGSGTLTNLFDDPGVALSLRNLMELMLLISDNSATDMVLKAAGGGKAVNERLAALGVQGISVDRPTIALIADAIGITDLGPESGWSMAAFRDKARAVSDAQEKQAAVDAGTRFGWGRSRSARSRLRPRCSIGEHPGRERSVVRHLDPQALAPCPVLTHISVDELWMDARNSALELRNSWISPFRPDAPGPAATTIPIRADYTRPVGGNPEAGQGQQDGGALGENVSRT